LIKRNSKVIWRDVVLNPGIYGTYCPCPVCSCGCGACASSSPGSCGCGTYTSSCFLLIDSRHIQTQDLILFWPHCPSFSTGRLDADLVTDTANSPLFVLFVWPPVGVGFLLLPPRLHGPRGQPPKFSRRENCWEVPKSHYAGVPCVLLSVTSLRYIRISTYMLTLVTSEVPRSLSRRKPRRFLRTQFRSIFQDTERETSYPTLL
jgi:hypothetical protein